MFIAIATRTQAGAAQRALQRGRTLAEAIPSPKPLPKPVEAAQGIVIGLSAHRFPSMQRRRVIDLVARMHGSTYAWAISPSRKPKHVMGRQAALCAVAELDANADRAITLNKLGSLVNRDHSTVIAAFRTRGYQEKRG